MKNEVFNRLTAFLSELEQKGISYNLAHYRDDAMMVLVALPGERWEIEFLADGSVEVEKFASNGEIYGEEALPELFARYSEEAGNEFSLDAELTSLGQPEQRSEP
jgi:hypothetical protein